LKGCFSCTKVVGTPTNNPSALGYPPNPEKKPYPGSEIVDLPQQCSVRQGLQFLLAWVRFFGREILQALSRMDFHQSDDVLKGISGFQHCYFGNLCYISGGDIRKTRTKEQWNSGTYS